MQSVFLFPLVQAVDTLVCLFFWYFCEISPNSMLTECFNYTRWSKVNYFFRSNIQGILENAKHPCFLFFLYFRIRLKYRANMGDPRFCMYFHQMHYIKKKYCKRNYKWKLKIVLARLVQLPQHNSFTFLQLTTLSSIHMSLGHSVYSICTIIVKSKVIWCIFFIHFNKIFWHRVVK